MGSHRDSIIALACGIAFLYVLHRVAAPYLNPELVGVGHDHGYYLPRLLEGYYWYLANGAFEIPWWTPAFCGGIPFFPDPQSIWLSLPQWLMFAGLGPLPAVHMSLLLFATVGGFACYRLLRDVYGVAIPWAMLSAGVFITNGFVLHHTLIGQVVWQPAMLVPAVAWGLLAPVGSRSAEIVGISVAAFSVATAFYMGMAVGLLPFLLAVTFLLSVDGLRNRRLGKRIALRTAVAAGLALGLVLAKLLPALAYLEQFPRDAYPLPGFGSSLDASVTWFRLLFLHNGPDLGNLDQLMVNTRFESEAHEFEFHLSPVLLPMLLIGAAWGLRRIASALCGWRVVFVIIALLCAALPFAINIYSPTMESMLKQVPVVRSSADNLRWWLFYVAIFPLLAAVAIDRGWPARWPSWSGWSIALLLAAISLGNMAWQDRSYYAAQPYDPRPVHAAYERARLAGRGPDVTRVVVERNARGRPHFTTARNDALIRGGSAMLCYEAMFGYRGEDFPWETLHPGPALASARWTLNVKHPACYVYPAENRCTPGAHFRDDQRAVAKAFLNRQPIPYSRPVTHALALRLSLLLLVLMTLAVAWSVRQLIKTEP